MKLLRNIIKIVGYAILTAIILFFLAPIMDSFKNQVTVYPISETDKGIKFTLNKSAYKVFLDTQTVITWLPGIIEVPTKLAKCSVRDRLHWHCEYSDGSGTLIMDGNRFEILSKDNAPERNTQYVSRLKWWWLSLGL
jgi:hypothetical protein